VRIAVTPASVEVADAWNLMSARLKLATAGSREYATAQTEPFAIAQRIGVPIQETATLYGRLHQAVRMLGGEQRDALTITDCPLVMAADRDQTPVVGGCHPARTHRRRAGTM
jgi:hypothetical protein